MLLYVLLLKGLIWKKNENLDICKKCGGLCCKKSGCDVWLDDITDKSQNGILNMLATGKYSIVALMHFKNVNGRVCNMPFFVFKG